MSELQRFSCGCLLSAAVIVVLAAWSARAEETTAEDAALIVTGWLRADADPLGANIGERVTDVAVFTDPSGAPSYYVVYLEPSGLVVVPADDGVEPIVAFAERGWYDPSRRHPFVALVTRDLTGRLTRVRGLYQRGPDSLPAGVRDARAKWELLRSFAGAQDARDLPEVDDERVPKLLETLWSQCQRDGGCPGSGGYCYDYYTPNHYPCGCVATAMAQVMRYHQHPTEGIGVHAYDITVDGTTQTAYTIGGDEEGGPYEWGLMVPVPADGATPEQCQAIGALCYDAGVAAGMNYTSTRSSAPIWSASRAFWPFTFDYGFAINGQAVSGFVTDPDLYEMVNPNLDYRHPVILKISNGPTDPHAVVADGYGYNAGTLYHHINMGWAGLEDAWYSFPLVAGYTVIDESIYNIFVTGSGEIISGRALDGSGDSVDGVIVTAKAIDGTFTTSVETDENGIYAVAPVPGNTTFRMSAAKAGFHTADKLVTTGQSQWYASVSGNRWGVDFTSSVMFVDVDAPDGGDGSSWANAYNRLQDALAAAQQGQQVWVAEGVYRPDQGSGITPDDRTATFTPGNCVTVCGGFAGDEDPTIFDLSWRDLAARETVLSGDVGIPGSVDDNSFHVITASGVDPTAILDGFVIQDGNADDYPFPPYDGGGAYVVSGSPTLRNCMFRANRAVSYGGGLYCDGGNPEVVNCTFTNNFAGTEGGGVAIWSGTPTLMHCTFTENEALSAGGGIANAGSATLANCAFIENLAVIGGGMVNVNCSPNLTNCTFTENLATGQGGGMYNVGSNLTVVNCILWGNSDESGSGEQAQMYTYSGTPTVTYSCIQDDDPDDSYIPYGGAANQNIDDDPWFLAGPTDCYYLSQTSAGQMWQSPCVDAGDGPASDHGLDSRTTQRNEGPDENVVDMGFHYAVSGASFVYGDFDRNGGIVLVDFLEFAECLVGPCPNPSCDPSHYVGPCCSIADFDDNCSLDLADFVSFQRAFGE